MLRSRAKFVYQQYQQLLMLPTSEVSQVGRKFPIPKFTEQTLKLLCKEFMDVLGGTPAVLQDLPEEIIVAGDIHGNLHNLILLFSIFGLPPFRRFTFLGDAVDGGAFSLEVWTILMALKCIFPAHIFILRGENEHFPSNRLDNGCLHSEVIANYSTSLWNELIKTFSYLPISIVSNDGLYFGNIFSIKEFASVEESKKYILPIPCQPVKPLKNKVESEHLCDFFEMNNLDTVICGGKTDLISDNQTGFFVTLSEPNSEVVAMIIQELELEPVKFKTPASIDRNEANFADLVDQKKYNIATLPGIVRPRIKPQKGFWHLGDLPAVSALSAKPASL